MVNGIEIIGIDFLKAYLEDLLTVQFRIKASDQGEYSIRVRIEDPFFGSDFFIGPTVVRCREGINFWASFGIKDIMTDPILGLTGGFIIIFENAETGKELYRKKFLNRGIIYGKRNVTSVSPYDSPRLFMVGDSHTWTTFGQHSEAIDRVGDHTMVRHVMYKVSSHIFWTGNFKAYLAMLPVENQDSFLFSFGTYDFRRGCFKASHKKGVPLEEIVYQTLFQKFYKLKMLREIYPHNHFIISSIVPPIRESFLPEDKLEEYLWNSSDESRLKIYRMYKEFWERQHKFLTNCSFLDWTTDYKDYEGFCKEELMRPGDIHVGDFKPALKNLENHLKKVKQNS
jgi:hypothetical protein